MTCWAFDCIRHSIRTIMDYHGCYCKDWPIHTRLNRSPHYWLSSIRVSTGIIQHPRWGLLQACAVEWHYSLDPSYRFRYHHSNIMASNVHRGRHYLKLLLHTHDLRQLHHCYLMNVNLTRHLTRRSRGIQQGTHRAFSRGTLEAFMRQNASRDTVVHSR